jgi:hypothetical protein
VDHVIAVHPQRFDDEFKPSLSCQHCAFSTGRRFQAPFSPVERPGREPVILSGHVEMRGLRGSALQAP